MCSISSFQTLFHKEVDGEYFRERRLFESISTGDGNFKQFQYKLRCVNLFDPFHLVVPTMFY